MEKEKNRCCFDIMEFNKSTKCYECSTCGNVVKNCECGNEFNIYDFNYKCPTCGKETEE